MCHRLGHDALEIGQDRLHRLTGFRRRFRQGVQNRTRSDIGPDRTVPQALAIGRRPFGYALGPGFKLGSVHGAPFLHVVSF